MINKPEDIEERYIDEDDDDEDNDNLLYGNGQQEEYEEYEDDDFDEDDEQDEEQEEHQTEPSSEPKQEKTEPTEEEKVMAILYAKAQTVDQVAMRILTLQSVKRYNDSELRQLVFEEGLRKECEGKNYSSEDIMLCIPTGSTIYPKMLERLYPPFKGNLELKDYGPQKDLLVALLNDVVNKIIKRENLVTEEPVEKVEEQPKEKEVSEFSDDYDDVLDNPEVVANVARITRVYSDLFEVGFELKKPYGVMTKMGSLRDTNKEGNHVITHKKETQLEVLYEIIEQALGEDITQAKVTNRKQVKDLRAFSMKNGINYYPEYQLANVMGFIGDKTYTSWRDFSTNITGFVQKTIGENFKRGYELANIVDSLTTAIVITEFNPKSHISLRINVGKDRISEEAFRSAYLLRKNDFMSGMGDLYQVTKTPMGILEVTLVFDLPTYNGRPLFAYEAILSQQERGIKPSIKNMVLGQDISGRILTTNLDTQQNCLMLIGAGQRSGKGVLTLNLLGTFFSEGSPVIYFDGKPDMAKVLWDLADKYNVQTATYDVFDSNGRRTGVGAPPKAQEELSDIFGLLAYLKMVQLMLVAARIKAKGEDIYGDKRPLFIFDEALAVQMTLSGLWNKMLAFAKDKKTDDTEMFEWSNALCDWVGVLDSDIPATINSQLPASGISTAWLFQVMQPTTWRDYKLDNTTGKLKMFESFITSRLSLKFLGRGTADSEYALGSDKVKRDQTVTQRVQKDGGRHFAMTGEQKIVDPKTLKIFKPYLVLNSSDPNSSSAKELIGNLSDDVKARVAPNGTLDPRTGFQQFAEMIGKEAIMNMQEGVNYLEAILKKVGLADKYSSVDEYIYSVGKDDFYTTGALVRTATEPDSIDEGQGAFVPEIGDFEQEREEEQELPTKEENTNNNMDDILRSELDNGHGQYQPEFYEDEKNSFETGGPQESIMAQQNQEYTPQTYEDGTFEEPSPNDTSHNPNIYQPDIEVTHNPFKETRSKGVLSTYNAVNEMSRQILSYITKMVGSLGRVDTLEFGDSGIVVNGIPFKPKFDEQFMESLPYDIKIQVDKGNLTELFNFKDLKHFSNISMLSIDNLRVAEGRARREIPHNPNKQWYDLMKKFPYMRELYIGGVLIQDEETSEEYEQTARQHYDQQEEIKEKLKVDRARFEDTSVGKIWRTKPVKIATGALGWTLGVKGVAVVATIFGGWGLLFGAFAGYGAYKTMKKRNE